MERQLRSSLLAAFFLWFAMFSPWTRNDINFWAVMLSTAVLLGILSFIYGRDIWHSRTLFWGDMEGMEAFRYWLGQIALGVLIAAVLWGLFWVGDKLSQLIFPFARDQVNAVYNIKGTWDMQVLWAMLLFVIGPAEEIFWRGYVQERLVRLFASSDRPRLFCNAPVLAMAATVLFYTLVHVPSLNFMLIMAALVCGAAWSVLYWLRPHWMPALILSHALWDAAVFIWMPL